MLRGAASSRQQREPCTSPGDAEARMELCQALLNTVPCVPAPPLKFGLLALRLSGYQSLIRSHPSVQASLSRKLEAYVSTCAPRSLAVELTEELAGNTHAAEESFLLPSRGRQGARACDACKGGDEVSGLERYSCPVCSVCESKHGYLSRDGDGNGEDVSGDQGHDDQEDDGFRSFSCCSRWTEQHDFYKKRGIAAWSDNDVPFGVSSGAVTAEAYARVIATSLQAHGTDIDGEHTHDSGQQRDGDADAASSQDVAYIVELGSGHCMLGYQLALRLLHVLDMEIKDGAVRHRHGRNARGGGGGGGGGGGDGNVDGGCGDDNVPRRRSPFKIVMTDMNKALLQRQMSMPCWEPLLAAGVVDFALLDISRAVTEPWALATEGLLLLGSGVTLKRGCSHIGRGGLIVVANYLVDSIPTDLFVRPRFSQKVPGYPQLWELRVKEDNRAAVKKGDRLSYRLYDCSRQGRQRRTRSLVEQKLAVAERCVSRGPGLHLVPTALLPTLAVLKHIFVDSKSGITNLGKEGNTSGGGGGGGGGDDVGSGNGGGSDGGERVRRRRCRGRPLFTLLIGDKAHAFDDTTVGIPMDTTFPATAAHTHSTGPSLNTLGGAGNATSPSTPANDAAAAPCVCGGVTRKLHHPNHIELSSFELPEISPADSCLALPVDFGAVKCIFEMVASSLSLDELIPPPSEVPASPIAPLPPPLPPPHQEESAGMEDECSELQDTARREEMVSKGPDVSSKLGPDVTFKVGDIEEEENIVCKLSAQVCSDFTTMFLAADAQLPGQRRPGSSIPTTSSETPTSISNGFACKGRADAVGLTFDRWLGQGCTPAVFDSLSGFADDVPLLLQSAEVCLAFLTLSRLDFDAFLKLRWRLMTAVKAELAGTPVTPSTSEVARALSPPSMEPPAEVEERSNNKIVKKDVTPHEGLDPTMKVSVGALALKERCISLAMASYKGQYCLTRIRWRSSIRTFAQWLVAWGGPQEEDVARTLLTEGLNSGDIAHAQKGGALRLLKACDRRKAKRLRLDAG